jgi:CheY-like chemotaxis protein
VSGTPRSVLVVEDSADDYEVIVRAFEKAGMDAPLMWCRTGAEALDFLKNGALPYFMLLDLNMPGMDGCDVLYAVKEDPRLKRLPVIVLTTSSSESDVDRCYAAGANAYVQKPPGYAALTELMSAIKRHWMDTVLLPQAI